MPYVYILQCSDTSLYVGCAVDLKKRIERHQSSKGAKYTKGRLPVQLVYSERFDTLPQAMRREKEIQKLPRKKKLSMIKERKLCIID